MYSAVVCNTKPYARIYSGHLSGSRSVPGGRQLVVQAAKLLRLRLLAAIGQTKLTHHHLYYRIITQRLCSRLTALWRYINFVLLLLLL